ncbi:hypothetical protein [Candidatus Methanocrinis natronophilus]|uniref:DUF4355 domain-containing protein n=1 Tax=Candidatus Methanocrinis natronophilus TaxID=3033396 RepID=A0ABT5XAB9_9EURY|nr:hypothetical protein [Candidatus Methanocrinis natronophilus]MDF0591661.1 hypothetical protein [Candidatus Methanocrinis natronophilus]
MTDDEKKFTQADVDRIVQERLNREKAKYADYEDLKRENEDLKAKIAEAETAGKAATLENLKQKVVTDLKLPPSLAGRLQGSTEEELKVDGAKLLKELGPREPVGGGGSPPGESVKPLTREAVKKMTPDQVIANMDQIKSQLKEGSLR